MTVSSSKRTFAHSLLIPLLLLATIWIIHTLQWAMGWHLGATFGVYPRTFSGLMGILTAPLIHGSWEHLASNSLPLVALTASVLYLHRKESTIILIFAWLAPSIWVWVAGRPSYHIGASGMLYALAFFLFFTGVFRKDRLSLTIALIVVLFHGSWIWGVLPIQEGVSWEGHLFGAIAGIILAFYFRKAGPPKKKYSWELHPESSDDAIEPWNYQHIIPPPEGFSYPGMKSPDSENEKGPAEE
ncbi:rhomboid family intramembrane serine protease [Pontibacter sp. G13]|uniref:rhomboid family intramembrane serine protease n=1 Tax=Pontibacter sp. G13 TaxID=3074898 RepID=UPI00288B1C35|nr:rhomboid family intramembrane serine protease [Pontibacter sp. G13]WNJ18555.1 rhomboid family intramembrane serine protease [Pontibacter sp. G13]